LSESEIPRSLNIRNKNVGLTFRGTSDPVIELDGRFYVLEERRIREVSRLEREEGTSVVFRDRSTAPPTRSATPEAAGPPLPPDAAVMNKEDLGYGPDPEVQQYVYELQRQAGELNDLRDDIDQRRARELIKGVHDQAEQAAQVFQRMALQQQQQYLVEIQQQNESLYRGLLNEWQLEQETLRLANQIQMLDPGREREERYDELKGLLKQIFDIKQENRRQEINQMEAELNRLKGQLNERESNRDLIIDRRLEELTGVQGAEQQP
jgi:hypothetical protein